MIQKTTTPRSKWLWLFGVSILAALLVSCGLDEPKNSSIVAPAGADAEPFHQEKIAPHIFDRLPAGTGILFSKSPRSDASVCSELWFQDAHEREHRVASDVVRASFSPDGQKFAYATHHDELFIESIEGSELAHFTGARDFSWFSDSARLMFSAMASVDYPDFEQSVVYDLNSGRMTHLPVEK
jgi:dipeptidyl aminopeptidase/acylaminoacyl peptidase